MVDFICLVILLLILWYPFEWVATRLILRAIRVSRKMDKDVVTISNELDKGKPAPTPEPEPVVTPSNPSTKDKKDKPKKGV